ncbi:MAG: ATP-dependent helicase [Filifactoraceae bacterium]
MYNLNKEQSEAVSQTDGPVLILAGAGSGKTRVITYRIAKLIDDGVSPYHILALTFTNKASLEMKERLEQILEMSVHGLWIGTFHSMCLRILRSHIEKIGYTNSFVIYDSYDQKILLKDVMASLNISEDEFKPAYFSTAISSAKDSLVGYMDYEKERSNDIKGRIISKVYGEYQRRLKLNNALDFDDIIVKTIELLEKNPDVKDLYQEKFKYVMVDEYQDSNHAQYVLIKLLTGKYKNICVVGDDDQSIYAWRGADIRNILDFENDYPKAKIIKLEQNYRSTSNILKAANSVIANNSDRKSKVLWTDNLEGDKIIVNKSYSDKDEAYFVANEIKRLIEEGYSNNDFAVLYRTNAQSRIIEDVLIKKGISYKIFGGLKFYDRKEIKDILAYLRLIVNVDDNISFKRIVNVPKRKIGLKTIEKIEEIADPLAKSLFETLGDLGEVNIADSIKIKLLGFRNLIFELKEISKTMNVKDFVSILIDKVGYIESLNEDGGDENLSRIENIKEFVNVCAEYDIIAEEPSVEDFISSISLTSDIDSMNNEDNYVSLITLHSAKGLEFPIVFIVGMEEGLFPSSRSYLDSTQEEEERRLCYVGITRAMKKLYLSFATERMIFGKTTRQMPSRFVDEIPKEVLKTNVKEGKIAKTILKAKSTFNGIREQSELLKKSQKEKNMSQVSLEAGIKVKHKLFGMGTIIINENGICTVAFDGKGIKKIDTSIVNLQIVGD